MAVNKAKIYQKLKNKSLFRKYYKMRKNASL